MHVVVSTPGPGWAIIVAAFGTIAVAAVAVWIAWWLNRQAGRQLAQEREAADKRHREAMAAADERLREDHLAAQEREQLAEAYAVQVTPAAMTPEAFGSRIVRDPEVPVECPVVVVVNHGHYTITGLQAQLRTAGDGRAGYDKTEYFSSRWNVPSQITQLLSWHQADVPAGVLAPADVGMRFSRDAMPVADLTGAYPAVRWRDHWGTCWEHKQGNVRRGAEDEDWEP
jgi:hypothetical protein